ncbi:putative TetR-family transcriptional regulator [Actinoplanes missouriensis 431]|uniref:Putative TetR-family transcriptional regulator n=1 Tax=Actinoplanes missouriensis (strain ATCC 14538 / DSM 43046 / CBS 188.64 / JCM 3121 / NBRC 102363 / NCIMB 12654 / NRRL B-3342 / UNCC 431) TaxID=512565 RepID=I0H992_ACTM4|nr:TetR family transcriptional regulator [Actinoplanes missouriensis]BAL89579.1 putative TetR-family transcriptional regulator [Actinoplanes missouriensis 431]
MNDTAKKPTLRQRTRQAMRAEVSAIATRLFAEQGCDNTTVEQIAAEAGLSRTTFFRYFGTKEDVVLTWLEELGPALVAAFRARPGDEHPWTSLRRTLDVFTAMNADAPERSLAFMRMLQESPTMTARYAERQQSWEDLLVPLVAERLAGDRPADRDPAPRALVASALACYNAAMQAWGAADGAGSRDDLLDRAMTALHA